MSPLSPLKKFGDVANSISTPHAPDESHPTAPPNVGCTRPAVLSRSTKPCCDPKLTPAKGLSVHCAYAAVGVASINAAMATMVRTIYFTAAMNARANGDTKTSPSASGKRALSPSLLASRISVKLRLGTFSSKDENVGHRP